MYSNQDGACDNKLKNKEMEFVLGIFYIHSKEALRKHLTIIDKLCATV